MSADQDTDAWQIMENAQIEIEAVLELNGAELGDEGFFFPHGRQMIGQENLLKASDLISSAQGVLERDRGRGQ